MVGTSEIENNAKMFVYYSIIIRMESIQTVPHKKKKKKIHLLLHTRWANKGTWWGVLFSSTF